MKMIGLRYFYGSTDSSVRSLGNKFDPADFSVTSRSSHMVGLFNVCVRKLH